MVSRHARAVVATALIIGIAGFAAACGGDSEDSSAGGGDKSKQVVMGMSFCFMTNPGTLALRDSTKEAAEKRGWKVLESTDANNDQATQLTQINNLLTQGIDVLGIHQCTADGVVPAIKKANEQGVVVFTPDQLAAGGDVAIAATVDNAEAAASACRELVSRLGDSPSGTIIQVQGDIGSAAGKERTDGFESCMSEEAPDVKILTVPTKWDAAEAARGVKSLLNANPEVEAIFMQSDVVFGTAVKQALTEIGRLKPVGEDGHMILFGIDASSEMLDMIRQKDADFAISQPLSEFGPVALPFVELALNGTLDEKVKPGTKSTLPGSEGMAIKSVPTGLMVVVPATLVTEKNVDSPDLWAN